MNVSGPHAVVMGDLVKSERFTDPIELHALFNAAVDRQNQSHAAALASPLTITLGDEFQGIARTLVQSVAIVRDLRLALLEQDIACRFVIGLVDIRTAINPDKAWNMMGPGLARARTILNDKGDRTHYRFSLPDHPILEPVLDAIGAGLTLIETGWSHRQRDDITRLVAGQTPADLAQQRNVTVHSVYKVRNSGNFDTYQMQWNAVTKALSAIDAGEGI